MEEKRQIQALVELTEEQRAEASRRYELIRGYIEEGVAQAELAREQGVPLSTLQRWVHQYQMSGLCGLARRVRSDRGKRRGVREEVVKVIEGLALRKPRRSMATIQTSW